MTVTWKASIPEHRLHPRAMESWYPGLVPRLRIFFFKVPQAIPMCNQGWELLPCLKLKLTSNYLDSIGKKKMGTKVMRARVGRQAPKCLPACHLGTAL